MPVSSWSTTPANNNSAPPNGWPEGMAPSAVNNTARQMMADIAAIYQGTEAGSAAFARTAAEIAAGVTPTAYQYPEGNVKRYGAVGDGTTDDSAALQDALDYWVATDGAILTIPYGQYKVVTPLVATFVDLDITGRTIQGLGGQFVSGLSSGYILTVDASGLVNPELVRYLTFRDLLFYGGSSDTGCFKIQGGSPGQSWLYGSLFDNIRMSEVYGNGFNVDGNFFESVFQNCQVRGAAANVTGFGFHFASTGGSFQSSIDIINPMTQYFLNGIRTKSPTANVNITGGTILQAYEHGIRLDLTFDSNIIGTHLELCWTSEAGNISNGGAGIRAVGAINIIGVYATTDAADGGMKYIAEVFQSSNAPASNFLGGDLHGDIVTWLLLTGNNGTLVNLSSRDMTVEHVANNVAINYLGTGQKNRLNLANSASPSVANGAWFVTGGTTTITGFSDGVPGQEIVIHSGHTVTFDTTGTGLIGSSVDIATVSGDQTVWKCATDGSTWYLLQFTDVSADNSLGT